MLWLQTEDGFSFSICVSAEGQFPYIHCTLQMNTVSLTSIKLKFKFNIEERTNKILAGEGKDTY